MQTSMTFLKLMIMRLIWFSCLTWVMDVRPAGNIDVVIEKLLTLLKLMEGLQSSNSDISDGHLDHYLK